MHTVLTICAGFITIVGLAIVILAVNRIERLLGQCEDHATDAQNAHNGLLEDRHRLTSVERDVEATRRELRKLSGKFYAELAAQEREREELHDVIDEQDALAYGDGHKQLQLCENWKAAQNLGPTSEAAKCECLYCTTRRYERRALRAALVPKTVQGQAETAKLNAGKP